MSGIENGVIVVINLIAYMLGVEVEPIILPEILDSIILMNYEFLINSQALWALLREEVLMELWTTTTTTIMEWLNGLREGGKALANSVVMSWSSVII